MNPIPRVSTRRYYDLSTGRALKNNRYHLYPKKEFEKIACSKEIAIMVHGLRNDNAGAAAKAVIARNRLRKLRYRHPVVGFSYDSNTTGAHLVKHARHALLVGQKIAKKNGRHLGWFIKDFKESSPDTKIRLLGHSLGSQVIYSALEYLLKYEGIIESVHLFGASIPDNSASGRRGSIMQRVVRKKITNYYAPADDVLLQADDEGLVSGPLGLYGASGRIIPKYLQKKVRPKNHRFASYAAVLGSFP
ncbi:MAG: DUF726 domain-containing protein [Nitrosopumilus sp. B06]|nr:MAG: DUF726 domain-containing protein [Nitrosopumilus sp. B06]